MNLPLMREGLGKFVDSLEVKDAGLDREMVLRNMEKLWSEVLLAGYGTDPERTLSFRQPAGSRDPVYITGLPFVSVCRDHFLPFSGVAAVGYIPDKEILGLSNVGKLVSVLSARFQSQESLTAEIADTIHQGIRPVVVGVYVRAQQYCMRARFPAQSQSEVVTTGFRGEDPEGTFQREFLELIRSCRG